MIKNLNQFLKKLGAKSWRDVLLLLLPFMLFFNHNPMVSFGRGEYETHYEINLSLLFLALTIVLFIPVIWKNKHNLLKRRDVQLVCIFALYNTLSILWSPEPLRGILTAGLIWILVGFFLIFLSYKNVKKLAPVMIRVYIYSAAFFSLYALLQLFLGSFPQTKDAVLLCPGCQAIQFGFPRPNAFSVEPQFFGSLLVAPILYLLHRSIVGKLSRLDFSIFLLLITVLFLTLSRGAIYSFFVAAFVLCVFYLRSVDGLLKTVSISLTGLFFALTLQGIATTINPQISDTFTQSIVKSVDQLTLGRFNLKDRFISSAQVPEKIPEPTTNNPGAPESTAAQPSRFQGYIEASTNERVDNTCRSLTIWSESVPRQLFGVGVGGTGYHFYNHNLEESSPWCKTSS